MCRSGLDGGDGSLKTLYCIAGGAWRFSKAWKCLIYGKQNQVGKERAAVAHWRKRRQGSS